MRIFEPSSKVAALKSPLAAVRFLLGDKTAMHNRVILESAAYIFGQVDSKEWMGYLAECEGSDLIPKRKGNLIDVGNTLNTTFGKWMYCVVRYLKPEVMIETGVAHGNSSWITLNAIHKNGKGQLISLDLPNNDTNPGYNLGINEGDTGWLVPDELRKNWELILGDTKESLPRVFGHHPQIDIFFHDSAHTYEHMAFEFKEAWPRIRLGGVLISDDVHANTAFSEFVDTHSVRAFQFNKGGCGIKG